LIQKNTFKRNESLKLKKIIEDIFIRKNSFVSFPLKVFMLETNLPTSSAVQLLISVPKRNFKNATDRNLLKRRIKEAYRKNKHRLHEILNNNNKQLAIVILYIHKDFSTYEKIEKEMILSLQKIENKYSQKEEE
jgi:ribonuclease P protein component